MQAISARGLRKTYGPTTALAGVDIDIAPGEAVAIMGASGSGKTTLLHALAGIVTPDVGAVHLATPMGVVDVARLSDAERTRLRRERFGFVFQEGMLVPELTAVENVALALMLVGAPRASAIQEAAMWLGSLGLAGMEDRRIGQLSGGQAQRVAIARAQVTGASIVFADEPTGALDSVTSAEVMSALLSATVGRGRTLVLVTHDEQVAARCSRVVRMRDGLLVDAGVGAADAPAAAPAPAAPQPSGTLPPPVPGTAVPPPHPAYGTVEQPRVPLTTEQQWQVRA
ncbi:ABC transporter ATP-binding protein [Agrococcus jejuensis]|uniref:Putative ABC transport system ATP-binding protein n=1 Tax=Agrococcus jejuensis TaxID=399736 RepID=A0A1G8D9V0_9MICO|nr:ABC transporter ATP-binding protein [Agrococcus jejuensis]SDH54139.1 putative ABC transport system ATP-binding protein [Agrococcus jejuensis]